MPLTLSYLDLNRFMARRMAKWRTVPRLVLLTVSSERRTLLHKAAWHTCLRTTAGFSWYRKANRQKARGELDLPFHHLSMELLTKCPEAGLDERRDPSPINGAKYLVQCTGGKTRNRLVSCTHTCWAKRWWVDETRYQNKKRRLVINCPPVQKNYAKNMNGVDRNDRDSADYTTSIRINRWYLRIFFWVLDRVIFSCYIIAVFLAASGLKPAWNKYRSHW
jgi:hypothetical protein